MNKTQERIIHTLVTIAADLPYVINTKMCAAIVRRTRIISLGFNKTGTSRLQRRFKKNAHALCCHAEIDAIQNALKRYTQEDLKRCDIYVIRVRKPYQGGPYLTGIAKPCKGCQKAIKHYGIRAVIYSENHSKEHENTYARVDAQTF